MDDLPAVVQTHIPELGPTAHCWWVSPVGLSVPTLGGLELKWDMRYPAAESVSVRVGEVLGRGNQEYQSLECVKLETEEGRRPQWEVASSR